MRPQTDGNGFASRMSARASSYAPARARAMYPRASTPAGQRSEHGARQSAGCAERTSSSTRLRAARIAGVSVRTTMPAATWVAQESISLRAPSISTTHRRHAPYGFKRGSWQSVGISMSCARATSRMVRPSAASYSRPSMDSFTVPGTLIADLRARREGASSHPVDRTDVAGVQALAALAALRRVDAVRLLLLPRDRSFRAVADAQRAACARRLVDHVGDEAGAAMRGTAPLHDVRVVLVAEVAQRGEGGVRSRLAQAAKRRRLDVLTQLLEPLDVAGRSLAGDDPLEALEHPQRPDPAARALPAGLVLRELEEEAGHLHHAGGVVEDDHAPGSHDRAGPGDLVVVDPRVAERCRDAAARRSAHLHRLERPVVDDPAADVEDDVVDGDPHRHLDEARALHLAGHREDLRSLALLGAHRGERLGAVLDDPGDVRERLDVVDAGGLA